MKVLVFSVHPDDETLGCGGALLKHKEKKDKIFCAFVTNGNKYQEKIIPQLNKYYGFTKYFQLGFPELELDDLSLNQIIPEITKVINEIKPDVLYIPNRSDVHSDHRKTFSAIIASTKSFRSPFIKRILMCEVISETDFAPALPENSFQPNVFVDISDYMNKKLIIMKIFESELMVFPYTRSLDSIKAHNRYRGSQINCIFAEAFILLKEII